MTSNDLAFLPLKVIRTGPGGKRTFEPGGKQRLIEACLQPGISISGMALKAGINANQLRKWLLQARRQTPLATVSQACAAAGIPSGAPGRGRGIADTSATWCSTDIVTGTGSAVGAPAQRRDGGA